LGHRHGVLLKKPGFLNQDSELKNEHKNAKQEEETIS
jgi:hypothetical protein